jgi:hypothetical protein
MIREVPYTGKFFILVTFVSRTEDGYIGEVTLSIGFSKYGSTSIGEPKVYNF